MGAKRFALFGGIAMIVVGALALIPSFSQYSDALPALKLNSSYGLFLGFIPMNIFNKLALITFGLIGVYAANQRATNLPSSINYSRMLFIVMTALAIFGAIPETNTLGGYWPLYGYNILVYAAVAIMGAYFGFALTAEVPKLGDYNDARQPTSGAAMGARTPANAKSVAQH